jgi:hypothetical protein
VELTGGVPLGLHEGKLEADFETVKDGGDLAVNCVN